MSKNRKEINSPSNKVVITTIAILGLVVFSYSLFNGFTGDDNGLIVTNANVHSVSNIPKLFTTGVFGNIDSQTNYYKPVTAIIYSFLFYFFHLNPFGYHLFQLLLHIANALLIFYIFTNFFKRPLSFLLAIIFLIHPINAETVISIADLQDVLYVFWGLLAVYITITRPKYSHLFQIVFLTLSIFSKETGLAFLLIVPLINLYWKEGKVWKSLSVGFFPLALYCFFRFYVAKIFFNKTILVPIMTQTLGQRLLSAPKIILFYLRTFIYSKDLLIFQSWTVLSPNFKDFYLPILIELIIAICFIYLTIKIYRKNPLALKGLLLFTAIFLLGLGIHSQILPLDQTVADRWFYFPIIGLLGMIGIMFENFFDIRFDTRKVWIFIGLIIAVLSVRTVVRSTNWKDNHTLYSHDIKINKNSAQLEAGLGYELFREGNVKEAEPLYLKAVEDFPTKNTWLALGSFYLYTNRVDKARESYENALKYGESVGVYSNLALIYLKTENINSSKAFIESALNKFPNSSTLLTYDAYIRYQTGDREGALAQINKAYSIVKDDNILSLKKLIESNQKIQVQF